MRSTRTTRRSDDIARGQIRPGNFQGHTPRARSHQTEVEAMETMGAVEGKWFDSGR